MRYSLYVLLCIFLSKFILVNSQIGKILKISLMIADEGEPPICKTTGRKKLTEDEYTEKLEAIIEAQFFPHIAPLRQLHSYINNQSNKFSLERLKRIYVKSDNISQNLASNEDEKKITLSTFLQQFISEDNSSFELLQEKSLQEHRRKYHWNYEQEDGKKSGMLALYYMNGKVLSIEERKLFDTILITDMHQDAAFDTRKNGLDHVKFRVRNQLFFPPLLKDSEDTCKMPASSSSAGPRLLTDGKEYLQLTKFDNSNNDNKSAHLSSLSKKKKGFEKEIQTANVSGLSSFVVSQENRKAEGGDVDGLGPLTLYQLLMAVIHPTQPGSVSTSGEMTEPSPLERPQRLSATDPSPIFSCSGSYRSKRAYEEVSMSPIPVPISSLSLSMGVIPASVLAADDSMAHLLFAVPASPLITWGEVMSAPVAIAEDDDAHKLFRASSSSSSMAAPEGGGWGKTIMTDEDGGPIFSMQPPSRRELTARALDSRGKHAKNNKKKGSKPHALASSTSTVTPSMHLSTLPGYAYSPVPSCISSAASVASRRSIGSAASAAKRKTLSSLTPAAQALAEKIGRQIHSVNTF